MIFHANESSLQQDKNKVQVPSLAKNLNMEREISMYSQQVLDKNDFTLQGNMFGLMSTLQNKECFSQPYSQYNDQQSTPEYKLGLLALLEEYFRHKYFSSARLSGASRYRNSRAGEPQNHSLEGQFGFGVPEKQSSQLPLALIHPIPLHQFKDKSDDNGSSLNHSSHTYRQEHIPRTQRDAAPINLGNSTHLENSKSNVTLMKLVRIQEVYDYMVSNREESKVQDFSQADNKKQQSTEEMISNIPDQPIANLQKNFETLKNRDPQNARNKIYFNRAKINSNSRQAGINLNAASDSMNLQSSQRKNCQPNLKLKNQAQPKVQAQEVELNAQLGLILAKSKLQNADQKISHQIIEERQKQYNKMQINLSQSVAGRKSVSTIRGADQLRLRQKFINKAQNVNADQAAPHYFQSSNNVQKEGHNKSISNSISRDSLCGNDSLSVSASNLHNQSVIVQQSSVSPLTVMRKLKNKDRKIQHQPRKSNTNIQLSPSCRQGGMQGEAEVRNSREIDQVSINDQIQPFTKINFINSNEVDHEYLSQLSHRKIKSSNMKGVQEPQILQLANKSDAYQLFQKEATPTHSLLERSSIDYKDKSFINKSQQHLNYSSVNHSIIDQKDTLIKEEKSKDLQRRKSRLMKLNNKNLAQIAQNANLNRKQLKEVAYERSVSQMRSIERPKYQFQNDKSLDTINSKSRGSVLGHGGLSQNRSSLLDPLNQGGRFKASKYSTKVKNTFGGCTSQNTSIIVDDDRRDCSFQEVNRSNRDIYANQNQAYLSEVPLQTKSSNDIVALNQSKVSSPEKPYKQIYIKRSFKDGSQSPLQQRRDGSIDSEARSYLPRAIAGNDCHSKSNLGSSEMNLASTDFMLFSNQSNSENLNALSLRLKNQIINQRENNQAKKLRRPLQIGESKNEKSISQINSYITPNMQIQSFSKSPGISQENKSSRNGSIDKLPISNNHYTQQQHSQFQSRKVQKLQAQGDQYNSFMQQSVQKSFTRLERAISPEKVQPSTNFYRSKTNIDCPNDASPSGQNLGAGSEFQSQGGNQGDGQNAGKCFRYLKIRKNGESPESFKLKLNANTKVGQSLGMNGQAKNVHEYSNDFLLKQNDKYKAIQQTFQKGVTSSGQETPNRNEGLNVFQESDPANTNQSVYTPSQEPSFRQHQQIRINKKVNYVYEKENSHQKDEEWLKKSADVLQSQRIAIGQNKELEKTQFLNFNHLSSEQDDTEDQLEEEAGLQQSEGELQSIENQHFTGCFVYPSQNMRMFHLQNLPDRSISENQSIEDEKFFIVDVKPEQYDSSNNDLASNTFEKLNEISDIMAEGPLTDSSLQMRVSPHKILPQNLIIQEGKQSERPQKQRQEDIEKIQKNGFKTNQQQNLLVIRSSQMQNCPPQLRQKLGKKLAQLNQGREIERDSLSKQANINLSNANAQQNDSRETLKMFNNALMNYQDSDIQREDNQNKSKAPAQKNIQHNFYLNINTSSSLRPQTSQSQRIRTPVINSVNESFQLSNQDTNYVLGINSASSQLSSKIDLKSSQYTNSNIEHVSQPRLAVNNNFLRIMSLKDNSLVSVNLPREKLGIQSSQNNKEAEY